MKHLTHTSWLKWIGGTIAALSVAIALSFSSAANAQVQSLGATPITIEKAEVAVKCGILAIAGGLSTELINQYVVVFEPYVDNTDVGYEAGYTVGVLDTSGMLQAGEHGSYDAARKAAALYFYKINKCTPHESI